LNHHIFHSSNFNAFYGKCSSLWITSESIQKLS
jgi:hypothetical protein